MFFEVTSGAILNIQYPVSSIQHLSIYGNEFTKIWSNG
jgi:hypothetical protein